MTYGQSSNTYDLGEIWKVFEDIQSQSVKQFRPMTMPLPRSVKPTSIYTGIDALAGMTGGYIPQNHSDTFLALTEDGCCFVAGKNTENRLLLENKTESSNLVELKLNFRVKNLAIGPCNSGFLFCIQKSQIIRQMNDSLTIQDSFRQRESSL